jgi:hypothetical protein
MEAAWLAERAAWVGPSVGKKKSSLPSAYAWLQSNKTTNNKKRKKNVGVGR